MRWELTLVGILAGIWVTTAHAAGEADASSGTPVVEIRRDGGGGVSVKWRAEPGAAGATEYRLQRTRDLERWENLGDKARHRGEVAEGVSPVDVAGGEAGFYRVLSRFSESFTAEDGAEALGVSGLFADELALVSGLSPRSFAERYPQAPYMLAIGFDPAECRFWREFNDPAPVSPWGMTLFSFALDPKETERMRQNGFVVSERLGASDFSEIYYRLFTRDLPVLVTTDAILHAWHRSFDALLADLERGYLSPALGELLSELKDRQLGEAWVRYGDGILRESVLDADYYLTVACSLWQRGAVPSTLGQDARVSATLKAIETRAYVPFQMFDVPDYVDFSQYTPRGHYPRYGLENYFQAMMWCGRVDLRVAGNPEWASLRQLGTAIVLCDLWRRSTSVERWRDMNRVLEVLVGPADSMNLDQLASLLKAQGLEDPAAITSKETLESLRTALENGDLGIQQIQGHAYLGGVGGQAKLPRSFALFGQRFVLDAWAMGQVTFDRILKPGVEPPEFVRRRRSYGLDVAFSVLANDQTVPDLVANILNPEGVRFRDGFEYQHNLAAVRATIDSLPADAWTGSVYGYWLSALRALSLPTTGEEYPQAMRTRAWTMKTLNTQLASWTQLKHDTVLYAKQIEVPPILCNYPAGFVEPRPEFFAGVRAMAEGARSMLSTLNIDLPQGGALEPYGTVADMQAKVSGFLGRFGRVCGQLEGMARKELAQEPFSTEESALLDNWMEVLIDYYGLRTYNGHYPSLFLRGNEGKLPYRPPPPPKIEMPPAHDCAQSDALITDILTAGPSDPDGDPGAVVHQAVGRVHCLLMAVDNGPNRMMYAGPVFSHYEFEAPLGERWTDETWKQRVDEGKTPSPPPWTAEFLVR